MASLKNVAPSRLNRAQNFVFQTSDKSTDLFVVKYCLKIIQPMGNLAADRLFHIRRQTTGVLEEGIGKESGFWKVFHERMLGGIVRNIPAVFPLGFNPPGTSGVISFEGGVAGLVKNGFLQIMSLNALANIFGAQDEEMASMFSKPGPAPLVDDDVSELLAHQTGKFSQSIGHPSRKLLRFYRIFKAGVSPDFRADPILEPHLKDIGILKDELFVTIAGQFFCFSTDKPQGFERGRIIGSNKVEIGGDD